MTWGEDFQSSESVINMCENAKPENAKPENTKPEKPPHTSVPYSHSQDSLSRKTFSTFFYCLKRFSNLSPRTLQQNTQTVGYLMM